ncbi:hypothetical protein TorRG33x02_013720 [Trema orientale]|uniref:Uncharacterized protein n=1 Tax=Trema orientale TaxID=63057 RepID=A0A2P5FX65_TREOI|nr:hypothetical protein TorRG33x02_013720 [Trema orientale]
MLTSAAILDAYRDVIIESLDLMFTKNPNEESVHGSSSTCLSTKLGVKTDSPYWLHSPLKTCILIDPFESRIKEPLDEAWIWDRLPPKSCKLLELSEQTLVDDTAITKCHLALLVTSNATIDSHGSSQQTKRTLLPGENITNENERALREELWAKVEVVHAIEKHLEEDFLTNWSQLFNF